MWIMDRTMKPIFPEGARTYPPVIGIGTNLLTPLGIALSMPRLSLVRNITDITRGTILSLPRSFPSVAIGTRAGRFRYTAMILFSSTDELWMHGKIAAHKRMVRRWIDYREGSPGLPKIGLFGGVCHSGLL